MWNAECAASYPCRSDAAWSRIRSMITAYILHDSGESEILQDAAGIADAWAAGVAAMWVDVAGEERAALEMLGDRMGIERPAIEDCFEGRQRPRIDEYDDHIFLLMYCLLYTSPSPRDRTRSRMPSSA